MEMVTREAMDATQRILGTGEQKTHSNLNNGFDFQAYLKHYNIETVKTKQNGTSKLYCLKECLFDPAHTPNEAAIGITIEGKTFYQCFHESCKNHTWQEARQIISGTDSLKPFMSEIADSKTLLSHNQHNKNLKAVSVRELLETEFKPREALLQPWLHTQGLAMIHSQRGQGKTHVGVGIAVAVTSGGKYLRWKAPKPFGTLYLDGEMPGAALQERFAQAIHDAECEPIAPLKIITPDLQENGMPDLSTNEGQASLEPHLEGVSLIIVDNISTLARTGRENEGESWLPLQTWALQLRSRGFSILFIHHDGKGGFQRGTSRKEDVLDSVIHLRRPGDYRPEQGARFEVHFEKARAIYGDDVKPFEAMLAIDPAGVQEWTMKDLEDSLTERVASLLNDGVPQHEIADLLGIAKGTVSKHKKKAQDQRLLK